MSVAGVAMSGFQGKTNQRYVPHATARIIKATAKPKDELLRKGGK
jgi:hypothetical protein